MHDTSETYHLLPVTPQLRIMMRAAPACEPGNCTCLVAKGVYMYTQQGSLSA